MTFNFSGIENVTTTENRIGEAEARGTETDGNFRLCKYAIFATSHHDVIEIYKPEDAHSGIISTLYHKDNINENYDIYFGRDTR